MNFTNNLDDPGRNPDDPGKARMIWERTRMIRPNQTAAAYKLKQAQLLHPDSDFDDLELVLKLWKKPSSTHREPPKNKQNGGCKICKGFIMYLGNLFGFGFSLVYRIGVELCIEDVDLRKSIKNTFDPLLIVQDPYK